MGRHWWAGLVCEDCEARPVGEDGLHLFQTVARAIFQHTPQIFEPVFADYLFDMMMQRIILGEKPDKKAGIKQDTE